MYHALYEEPSELDGHERAVTNYWLSAQAFERQIGALAGAGYQAIPLAALLPGAPPIETKRPVVLTFDDGWQSDHRLALPILKRFGWRAEHFVTVGWTGRPGFMSWAELAELRDAGMGVHSHSLTHAFLSDLPDDELRRELQVSKMTLEERLGLPVELLALPGGRGATRRTRAAAAAAGYRGTCTSVVGLNRPGGDPHRLRRLAITRDTTPEQLLRWVAGAGIRRMLIKRTALLAARRIMGPRLYETLKAALLSR